MRKTLYISALCLLFFGSSCAKHFTEGTIYRDCTGTYLKIDTHYYNIVNRSKVESILDNETIRVQFQTSDGPGPDVICMMVSVPSAGFIEILTVKE